MVKDLESDYQQEAQSAKKVKPEIQEKLKEIILTKSQIYGNLALGHFKRDEIDEFEFYNSSCLQFDP